MPFSGVSVIIPNWNGKKLLEKNLPPLFEALEFSNLEYEVIIVDDASTDESAEFIRQYYPQIKLIVQNYNKGFGESCNNGVRHSQKKIIYFLNTDVTVDRNFLPPLFSCFNDDSIFAVCSIPISKEDEGKRWYPIAIHRMKYGLFMQRHIQIKKDIKEPVPIFFAPAGHAAYDKEKFIALNGFDSLYSPFFYEDIDICYQAWKRGWKSLAHFQSKVKHKTHSTIDKRCDSAQRQILVWERKFLFMWKNIQDLSLFSKHIFFLPTLLLGSFFTGRSYIYRAFFQALKRLPEVQRKRRAEGQNALLTDRDILNQWHKWYPKS